MKNRELNRRKDICIECKRLMPIKAKDKCQNCWHKFKRKNDINFYLRTRFAEVRQRCVNKNKANNKGYLGREYCTLTEFLNKFISDPTFLKLFKEWKESGYEYKLNPSVNRIDTNKGYTLDNIEFMTHSQNSTIDQDMTPVNVYTKDGEFIRSYESQGEASRQLNLFQANIFKVLIGDRTHTGGYRFEYKKS